MVVMLHRAIIREGPGETVEIWCQGGRQLEAMKKLLEEAERIRALCDTSIFVMIPAIDGALVVFYTPHLKVTALRRKVRTFCGISPGHSITIEYLSGGEVRGKTVAEAGLRAGDSLRWRWC